MSESDRFVLYRRGLDTPAANERARIRATPGLCMLDEASPRLLLVECSEAELRRTLRDLEGWTCERERTLKLRSAELGGDEVLDARQTKHLDLD